MEERAVSSQAPQDQVSGCLSPQDTYGALTALRFWPGVLEKVWFDWSKVSKDLFCEPAHAELMAQKQTNKKTPRK